MKKFKIVEWITHEIEAETINEACDLISDDNIIDAFIDEIETIEEDD